MVQLFKDYAKSTLASGITSGATTLTVQTGDGAKFPAPTSPDFFEAVLENAAGTVIEEVKVTAISTDTFTIVRGINSTTAAAWSTGDKVELRITSASLSRLGSTRKAVAGTTTLATGDGPIVVTNSGSNFVLTLPTSVGADGETYRIVNIGAGVVTVTPNGAQTVGFLATWDLEKGDFLEIFSDNANWLVKAATYRMHSKLFTAGGTFRAPQGCTSVIATCQAGGGGSGGVTAVNSSSGGGGASGECRTAYVVPVPGTDYTVTVGAGGTAGTASGATSGGTGGASSLGALLSAAGGLGGHGDSTGTGDQGGAGTVDLTAATAFGSSHIFPYAVAAAGGGNTTTGGSAGQAICAGTFSPTATVIISSSQFKAFLFGGAGGTCANAASGGGGGASMWGGAAAGATNQAGGLVGVNATANSGSGAGGACAGSATGAAHVGGVGGSGFVRVTWFQ